MCLTPRTSVLGNSVGIFLQDVTLLLLVGIVSSKEFGCLKNNVEDPEVMLWDKFSMVVVDDIPDRVCVCVCACTHACLCL